MVMSGQTLGTGLGSLDWCKTGVWRGNQAGQGHEAKYTPQIPQNTEMSGPWQSEGNTVFIIMQIPEFCIFLRADAT